MGSSGNQLQGPDLGQGVLTSELKEGQLLLGHAGGEAVLLARRGTDILAIGASCTHYGGPLAEGILIGDQVRCPWHHACFNLRTGQAERPPALNPVDCYQVERRADRVFVLGKRPRPARRSVPPARRPAAIVIVGAGAAGAVAAETLRADGYEGALTLVSGDPAGPVDRPNLSKDYLAGSAPEEWIPLRGADFYRERAIRLLLGVRAARIDKAAAVVTLSDGTTLPYDALLLATGADPVRLAIPGAELGHVFTLRTLADSRAVIAAAGAAKRAVVVGSSFIGLEVAAALRARGIGVDVVGLDRVPLERVLGPELGGFIQRLHERNGVTFHLGASLAAIEAGAVRLQTGATLAADLVVLGVGVRPSSALAEQAGCAVDRGVVVDGHLETTVGGIYAAGDLARWPDPYSGQSIRVEHWVLAQRLGQHAARSMLGRRERFAAVPFFWSAHYDASIRYVGHAEKWSSVTVRGDLAAGSATVAYRQGARVVAVATLGRDHVSLEVEAAMERGDAGAVEAAANRG